MHKTSDRHDSTSGSFHINISYICGVNWNKFHFAHCRYSVQRQQCSKQNVIRSVVKSRPNGDAQFCGTLALSGLFFVPY